MDNEQFDSIAAHLIASYTDTATYSRQFRDEYEFAPSRMANVHHLRSIVQARLTHDERYRLSSEWAEFGRVAYTDSEAGKEYLLRSVRALDIERAKRFDQLVLFAVSKFIKPSTVQLLIYDFQQDGLELSVAPAASRKGQRRLHAVGDPVKIGFWPYSTEEPPPFDQRKEDDPFKEIGDLGDDEEQEGESG